MSHAPTARLAWLVPVAALWACPDTAPSTDADLVVSGVVGLVGGLVWQRLDRRDVVERLVPVAAFGIVALVLLGVAALRSGGASFPVGPWVCGAFVAAGVVLAEAVFRLLARRAERTPV